MLSPILNLGIYGYVVFWRQDKWEIKSAGTLIEFANNIDKNSDSKTVRDVLLACASLCVMK